MATLDGRTTPKKDGQKVSLEDFDIKNLIGKGAFGEVYLVRHKETNRLMALKMMSKKLIDQEKKREHVKTEKKVLTDGRSPFLVKMHYSFQSKEHLFIVMEYCPGGDLKDFLSALGVLEEHEATIYFAEMIMAVHTLHEMGYIHRDLKPDNFLIDSKGHLKLADFGLSKANREFVDNKMDEEEKKKNRMSFFPAAESKERERLSTININRRFRKTITLRQGYQQDSKTVLPNEGNIVMRTHKASIPSKPLSTRKMMAFSVVGTPYYMSPEVCSSLSNGNSKGYDEVVDWWSLGCCFFEMILGVPPIQADSAEEIFNNINNWQNIIPPLLDQYKEHMSNECFNLLKGLLCNPEERLGKDIKKLKTHPFFKNLDWNNLYKETPPFVPKDEYVQELTGKENSM